MAIKLNEIIPISNIEDYKLHLACWNGENHPLDVFVRDFNEWVLWNAWRSQKDDFNRDYIFSLIEFYPESDTWLFGGIYKVLSRKPKNYSHSYEIQLSNNTEPFIGRLKLLLKRPSRAKSFLLENYYDNIYVSEILNDIYQGDVFPGYENINHSFSTLESIFIKNKNDWKTALEKVKGIYLITDISNNKRYIGSAYGEAGIWSRWSCYLGTGHGWNDELTKLIHKNGIEYARNNFIFSLLEYRSMKTDDNIIIGREIFWKEVLLSRGDFGYNKN